MLKSFKRPRDRAVQRHLAHLAVDMAAEAYSVSPNDILSSSRSQAQVARARQISMYLSHVIGQLTVAQVSEEFSRDRTTVTHALHIIEDRRDSPIFEQQMQFLERAYKKEVVNLHRNWLATSQYHKADIKHSA
ncbi:MAG: helix-turn-helix domain-containing protein [Pseudomonadota bacterium]